jgi:hypothetical protein
MKTTLAIFCILAFAWSQVVQAHAPAAGVGRGAKTCCCSDCGAACCCVAPESPESPPVPAVPVSSSSQDLLSLAAPAASAWILPTAGARELSFSPVPARAAAGVPLYARNCALLL